MIDAALQNTKARWARRDRVGGVDDTEESPRGNLRVLLAVPAGILVLAVLAFAFILILG